MTQWQKNIKSISSVKKTIRRKVIQSHTTNPASPEIYRMPNDETTLTFPYFILKIYLCLHTCGARWLGTILRIASILRNHLCSPTLISLKIEYADLYRFVCKAVVNCKWRRDSFKKYFLEPGTRVLRLTCAADWAGTDESHLTILAIRII